MEMTKIKKKLHTKDGVLLGLIASIIALSLLVGTLAQESVALNPDDEELGQGAADGTGLVINEIMTSNAGAYADPKGDLYDWIELYNGSSKEIQLFNYGLSDTLDKTKWVFPEVSIPAKGYLVVYLSGKDIPGLYANFSLKSAGGETLVLRNPSGNVIESYQLPEILSGKSIGRNAANQWVTYRQITPGYENSVLGYEAFIKDRITSESPLKITEFLPENQGNFLDKTFGLSGYIEVTNVSDQTVQLKNYALGDSLSAPFRWRFPAMSLAAGKSVVVYTSGISEIEGKLSTGFTLNEINGTVLLTNDQGKILDQATYENLPNGYAMAYQNDRYVAQPFLSPGYANDPVGTSSFNASLDLPNGLIINEAMNNNTKYLPHNGAQTYDWIELFNNSSKTISLSEYTLTTSENTPSLYPLPDIQLAPGEYYILMASGETSLSTTTFKHTNFKLSDVESIYLYHQGKLADTAFLAEVPINYSVARSSKGGFTYSSQPTPRTKNIDGETMVSAIPQTKLAAGVYDDVNTLTVALDTYGKTYYTLDGSKPNSNSRVYTSPLTITQTTVVRAITIENDKVPSGVATFSYVVNESHTLPVLSVAMNPGEFTALQKNPWVIGTEYASHVELFENGEGFAIDCGFQLFGGSTRGLAKKSFELNFRSEYGPGMLHYQVFDQRDFSVFNKLVLRSGSQDFDAAFFRDILSSEIMEDSETVEVQAYKSIILYINGKYWGVYDIREKVDEYFVSTHYNVDKNTANVVRADWDVSAGSMSGIYGIVSYADTHDLSVSANYQHILDRLDIESYIDFWVAETFVTNNDIINTRYISSSQYDGGKWHMVIYDLDYAWYNYYRDYFAFMVKPEGMSDFKVSTVLMRNLMKNDDFRRTFLERLQLNLAGIWSEANVNEKIETMYTTLKPEMARDSARWGFTMESWEKEVQRIRDYTSVRTRYLLDQAKAFFGLSNSEFEDYFGDFV